MATDNNRQTQSTEMNSFVGTPKDLDKATGGREKPSTVYVREVCVNYRGSRLRRVQIKNSEGAKHFFDSVQKDNSREHFMALFLDGGHQVVSYATISTGTANSALVHPREVFQAAIISGAAALIVAHNHPSGRLDPSEEDRRVTRELVTAGQVLGIPVLDHLIVTDESFLSFADERQME